MIKAVPDNKALLDFAHWVASMVCVEDDIWIDTNRCECFAELACRRLFKLGIITKDSEGNWTYDKRLRRTD